MSLSPTISSVPTRESKSSLTVADAIWVCVADLQRREGSGRPLCTFPTEFIVDSVQSKHLTQGAYKSIWQHVNQHCVANRKAQPNRLCYLFATGGGNRRLWRVGDRRDPTREGAATHPAWDKLPAEFAYLRRWYEEEWNFRGNVPESDPLLDLVGTGRHIWADEHADEYVANLRSNWGGAL
jgi:hypothetical protein